MPEPPPDKIASLSSGDFDHLAVDDAALAAAQVEYELFEARLARLSEEDSNIYRLALIAKRPRRILLQTIAGQLGWSRFKLYRRLRRIERIIYPEPFAALRLPLCEACGELLPLAATKRRRFCDTTCRVRAHRAKSQR
jgi:hypothetical protein